MFVSLASLVVIASAASAQPALILGETPARDCLEAAQSTVVTREDEAVCARAVADPRLTRTDRTASLVNYGIVLRKRGQSAQALSAYDRAAELSPDLAEIYLNRSAAQAELGNDRAALSDINRALELGPQLAHVAHFNRALILERRGDAEAAYADLLEALRLHPDYAPARQALERYQVSARAEG